MAKINRISGDFQAFGSAAVGTERTVFGGVTQSDIIDDNITANFLRGWGIVGVNENPTKQDFNALGFTLSQVLAYLHQQGVASWDTLQEYNVDAITTKSGVIYISQSDANIGNDPATDSGANWLSVTGGVPVGAAMPFFGGTVHAGFLKANGAAVRRTSYAALFAEIGTTYGVGNGSTTFNLPDSRGEFLRGWDDARGVDAGRVLGSWQADQNLQHTHTFGGSSTFNILGFGGVVATNAGRNAGALTSYQKMDVSGGGTEARPRNLAVQFLIKY